MWLGPTSGQGWVQPARIWRRACGLGRRPEPCLGPRPSLALNFGPSLKGCLKIPKAFEHFGSNLSVLEAVWKLQKLFIKVPESVAFAKTDFQSGLRSRLMSPRQCWGLGRKHTESPG